MSNNDIIRENNKKLFESRKFKFKNESNIFKGKKKKIKK